jgi:hypothetical protein
MHSLSSELFSWLACRFRGRVELELKVIALRHQLAVLRRQRPERPQLFSIDPPNLGVALSAVAAIPEGDRGGEAGHRHSMASAGLSPLLALAVKVRTARNQSRGSKSDPADVQGQPALGCAAHSCELLKLGIEVSQATVAK